MSETLDLITMLGGETVVYTPYGGSPKAILAVVERDRPSQDAQVVNGQRYSVNTRQLLIAKDAVEGVASILEHKDKVRFKKNLSDAADTDFTVQTVMKQDDGFTGTGGAFVILCQA